MTIKDLKTQLEKIPEEYVNTQVLIAKDHDFIELYKITLKHSYSNYNENLQEAMQLLLE